MLSIKTQPERHTEHNSESSSFQLDCFFTVSNCSIWWKSIYWFVICFKNRFCFFDVLVQFLGFMFGFIDQSSIKIRIIGKKTEFYSKDTHLRWKRDEKLTHNQTATEYRNRQTKAYTSLD